MTAIPHRVHLVGIGGMHMSAIARILLTWGHEVTGSDLRPSPLTKALGDIGAKVYVGHDAGNLGTPDLIVTTSAAHEDNPELVAAKERGLTIIKRAEMVARLMEGRVGLCIAGTHGKSTTSGMVAYLLAGCGRDPTYLIGAEVAGLGNNAAAGTGEHVVVEADEYDRAFLSYQPRVGLVTNVEPDHLDYYKTYEAMKDAFAGFAATVQPGGALFLCADSEEALSLRSSASRGVTVETYALDHAADWRAEVLPSEPDRQAFRITHSGSVFGDFATPLAGRHNVQNALGAIAVGHVAGLGVAEMAPVIARYTGVRRRFERVGEAAGIEVFDDYAHHPTEVEATVAAIRQRFPGKRLVALFQPHTYARSRYLLAGFRTCFSNIDRLFILETYAAREAIADGITGEQLAAEITAPPATYARDFAAAADMVAAELRRGDVFFTVGAGDVDTVGPMVLERLTAGVAR